MTTLNIPSVCSITRETACGNRNNRKLQNIRDVCCSSYTVAIYATRIFTIFKDLMLYKIAESRCLSSVYFHALAHSFFFNTTRLTLILINTDQHFLFELKRDLDFAYVSAVQ